MKYTWFNDPMFIIRSMQIWKIERIEKQYNIQTKIRKAKVAILILNFRNRIINHKKSSI